MNTTLGKWMTLFIAVTIMFTPILTYLDALHREAVDQVIYQNMKEASIEGYVSPTIIANMTDTLITDYNFEPTSIISITGTSMIVPRGGFIEAEITVKRTPMFIMNMFNQGEPNYTRTFTIMSEHLQ